MIYLFSQIAISLGLAAIVGGALGWIAHRARSGKQIRSLQQVVTRPQQQVSQAQTEVSILTDDFDDLKAHSASEINALTVDNQKIPALNQNLEKSQLLVRQLMQKHSAEIGELESANLKQLANGMGNIVLTLKGVPRLGYLMLWPHARSLRFVRPQPMLRAIPEAQRIAALLFKATKEVQSIAPSQAIRPERSNDIALEGLAA